MSVSPRLIALLIVLVTLLSACQGAAAGPLPPRAAATEPTTATLPAPSATPTPVPPTATSTPPPTATRPSPTPTQPPLTTLLFTGVIVPARCVQAALDVIGDPYYPYEEVGDVLRSADLAIGTFNATMSDSATHTGCIPTYRLVGSSNNADALAQAGFDAMSVATNHIKNCSFTACGDQAFFDTLANLERVGIAYVGAGDNHAEAMEPLVLTVNGVRFGIVSLGQIEHTAFAGEDTPGIAILNSENIKAAVAAARAVADVVIFMPHWGPEDMAVPNWIQRNLAVEIVAAGADLVMGNHTHVVQAIQEIDGIPVFYGLGNFVFDQGLRDHRQGVILKVFFEGTRYTGYELIPTHVDPDGRVHIAGPDEAQEILDRVQQASESIR